MKKIFILILALALAACGAPATEQPAAVPPEPSATPVVIVQTVVVEATLVPTDVPPPSAVPPTAAPVVVTVVVEPTQPPAPTAAAAGTTASGGPISLDNALGAGVFINMTMSGNVFTLRCFPRDITFNVTANNPAITDTLFYYRIVDLQGLYPSEWKNAGEMTSNGNGNFTLLFTGENVHPDLRLDKAWFDFQFVGLNKAGTVVDRTQKIEKLVTYSLDC